MVQNDHGAHGLYHGNGAWQDAGVVPTLSLEGRGVAVDVDGLLLAEQGGHGLEGYAEVDVLSVGDASLYAAAVVGLGGHRLFFLRQAFLWAERSAEDVVLFAAPLSDAAEAGTILEDLRGSP